jgi:hypothetical protein
MARAQDWATIISLCLSGLTALAIAVAEKQTVVKGLKSVQRSVETTYLALPRVF